MKHIYLISFVLCLCGSVSAQRPLVRGVVKDAVTSYPVSFCSVALLQAPSGTTADAGGRFTLHMPDQDQQRIVLSNVGYITDTVAITSAAYVIEIFLQPMESVLGNIVVTGVSRATLARENPVAVQTVSSKAMEHTTENNVIDVLVKNVPGLNAVKTGPNVSKPFIRGLGYNRVLTLYDGIRQEGQQWGDEHGIEIDVYNIERAEVIKGPASIMYGSDALAGVVSLIPAGRMQEKEKLQGKYVSEYQTNNGLTGNGIRFAYSTSHWTYLAAASYRFAKNYTNRIDGRVYNTGYRETNLSAGIRYDNDRGYSAINLTLYDNLQGIPDGSRDSVSRKFTRQTQEGGKDTIKSRAIVPAEVLNTYKLSPLHQHIQHYRLYGSKHIETGKGNVDVQLAFQQNIRREYNHPSLPQQAGMYVRLNTLNYGFRYNSLASAHTDISFGINGMYQNNTSKKATDFPIPDYDLFDAGAYALAKWKKEAWTVSAGTRYDIRYLHGNDFYTIANAPGGFMRQALSSETAVAYLQFPAFSRYFKGLSLSIGATYQLNEWISLKANIARGYRAPGITEFGSNGLDPGAHIIYLGNRNFVPEFGLQEDIGADIYNRDITISASLFNNNVQHYIYLSQVTDANGQVLMDAQGNRTYQYQQAAAQLYGLEVVAALHPAGIKGFQISNAFSAVYGYNRKPVYKGKNINGAYLPLIPPIRLLSSASQVIPVNSKTVEEFTGKIEAEYNAAQHRYLALDNTETPTPAYTLFNISCGTKIRYASGKTLDVQLQVSNIFDKTYHSGLSRLKCLEYYAQPAGSRTGIYDMGRNICLKVIMQF